LNFSRNLKIPLRHGALQRRHGVTRETDSQQRATNMRSEYLCLHPRLSQFEEEERERKRERGREREREGGREIYRACIKKGTFAFVFIRTSHVEA